MAETPWLLLCGSKSFRLIILPSIPWEVGVQLPLQPRSTRLHPPTHRGVLRWKEDSLFLNSASKPLMPWTREFPERYPRGSWGLAGVLDVPEEIRGISTGVFAPQLQGDSFRDSDLDPRLVTVWAPMTHGKISVGSVSAAQTPLWKLLLLRFKSGDSDLCGFRDHKEILLTQGKVYPQENERQEHGWALATLQGFFWKILKQAGNSRAQFLEIGDL
jgi:hypothetical protein